MKPIEVKEDTFGDTELSHPAFGMISIGRRQIGGGSKSLYGSDLHHNTLVAIDIQHCTTHRSLSNDKHFPRGTICSIEMSESQWATFVSSFNASGVPVTLRSHKTGAMVHPPEIEYTSKVDTFQKEFEKTHDDGLDYVKDAHKTVKSMLDGSLKMNKTNLKDIEACMSRAQTMISSNLEFVADMFAESMEKNIESAKSEIHAHFNTLLHDKGLEALSSGAAPVQIGDKR